MLNRRHALAGLVAAVIAPKALARRKLRVAAVAGPAGLVLDFNGKGHIQWVAPPQVAITHLWHPTDPAGTRVKVTAPRGAYEITAICEGAVATIVIEVE